ncbi:MAG TPA: MBL fold metallo-hydrolase [Herpetosiphonaceae bacterium]
MKITFWGTRGSLATPGPETSRYGGNTSCVEVRGADDTVLVLDAGTGIRRLGINLPKQLRRVDVLLSHLHMDHIQGLGFFGPLYNPNVEVHVWGPASTTLHLENRLSRYLSPPLFPIRLRDLPCKLVLHEVPDSFQVGEFSINAEFVCHPGPTVGYRIAGPGGTLAYLPDHEPAMGLPQFPLSGDWTSGYSLAEGVDVLIHDAQYSSLEDPRHVGWGHSSVEQAIQFAMHTKIKHLVLFHHDPAHNDEVLDHLINRSVAECQPGFPVTTAAEGECMTLEAGEPVSA